MCLYRCACVCIGRGGEGVNMFESLLATFYASYTSHKPLHLPFSQQYICQMVLLTGKEMRCFSKAYGMTIKEHF